MLANFNRAWSSLVACGDGRDQTERHYTLTQEHLRWGQAVVHLSRSAGEKLAALPVDEAERIVVNIDLFGHSLPTEDDVNAMILAYPTTYRG